MLDVAPTGTYSVRTSTVARELVLVELDARTVDVDERTPAKIALLIRGRRDDRWG